MNKQVGFTLVEILIAVAILSILMAIAVPSYNSYVMQSRRTDATVLLIQAAGEQQRYFTENNQFAPDMTTLGYGADDEPTENGHYTVASALTTNGFVLTATPQGAQISDTICGNLTINSVGVKGKSGSGTVADCW